MLKSIDFNEIVGKTIKAADIEETKTILVFTDGTFTYRTYTTQWDCVSATTCGKDMRIREVIADLGQWILPKLGIAEQSEIDVIVNENKAEDEKRQDERDRLAYEKLKKKFEGK